MGGFFSLWRCVYTSLPPVIYKCIYSWRESQKKYIGHLSFVLLYLCYNKIVKIHEFLNNFIIYVEISFSSCDTHNVRYITSSMGRIQEFRNLVYHIVLSMNKLINFIWLKSRSAHVWYFKYLFYWCWPLFTREYHLNVKVLISPMKICRKNMSYFVKRKWIKRSRIFSRFFNMVHSVEWNGEDVMN